MSTITATINGARCVSAIDAHTGYGSREVWMLSLSTAAYTGATDDLAVADVGATIGTYAKDGKTRTLRWATPGHAGYDTNGQAVYAVGESVQALAVSSDALTGNIGVAAGTEVTTSTAASGIGLLVGVDIA